MKSKLTACIALVACAILAPRAEAGEVCGNGADDDGDGLADEGCYSGLVSSQCESPLSCSETGMVSPLLGALHYQLPADVAPKVPYGPGIGLRRFYLSQAAPGITAPPSYQAKGTEVSGTAAVTPAWPAHQANDVALLVVETAGTQPATLSVPQGFALLGSQADNADINGTTLTVFWKRATGSSEAAPTVADSGDHQLAQILTFRNVATTGNPWDVTAGDATAGTASLYFYVPGATTTLPNTLVVSISGSTSATSSAGWYNPNLEGGVERTDVNTSQGNAGHFAVLTGIKRNPGPYGVSSGSLGVSSRQARMSIALRPVDSAPVWKKPMGDRWHHTYMTWLTKTGSPPSSVILLHTNRGQDIRATYASAPGDGWQYYSTQTGYHVRHLRQRIASPYEFELRTLTGETLVYDSTGRLTEIWDTLASPNTNKVTLAYDGNGQVSTVTDASTKRRLLFAYTSNQLTSVQFQVKISGVFTTYHTTSYGYTSSNLTTVTIGGQLAQTNAYTGNQLTQIQDGGGTRIVAFAYNESAGRVAQIDTTSGVLGYEYASSRAACTGKTVLYFNLGNTSSCNVDSDCGSGFLCGGKTGSGSTGRCFRGARCLTVTSPSEDVITSVTAIGPPSESCEGSCLQASQYIWNTGSGVLDLAAVQDPAGFYTVKEFNSNGLPTRILYGDSDSNPANGGAEREVFLLYDSTFVGRVSEVRRQSDLGVGSACTSSSGTCAVTSYIYNANGKLGDVVETGYMLNSSNNVTTYHYSTDYTYDTKGRLIQIEGPLGANQLTTFAYHSPTGGLDDDFLYEVGRKKNASSFLYEYSESYDFWGNPTSLKDADGTFTCLTFTTGRGYLAKRREAMAGQTSCATTNAADIETIWTRDSHLRLTQVTRPDGSCLFYEYDSKGRLQRTKRRDDCNVGSSGDRQEYVYDAEGLLTELQTYDASSTLTAKQPFTYFDSRQLAKVINPVDVSKWTGLMYDPRGILEQVDAPGGLGKTLFKFLDVYGVPNREGRVQSVDKYKTSSTFDTWNLFYSWLGDQTQVTDGDAKSTDTVRDDLGRVVRFGSQDMDAPRLQLYDAASRMTTVYDAYGISAQRMHSFTFDNLGRPLTSDYAVGASEGTCFGSTNPPEVERVYDAPPVTCPIGGGCNRTAGRLAYSRSRIMCVTSLGTDWSLDQETFYSYDDAGRMVVEYIRDDAGRVAQQQYSWTKNGALTQMITPSSISLQWSYGSGSSNSDTDLVTAQSRNGTGNPVTNNILWNPYGPLKQYNQLSTLSGTATRTRITRNLAYRPTGIYTETQSGGTTLQSTVLAEDAKGRMTKRDYTPNTLGVQDSYFVYDDQDRVVCETTSNVGSCSGLSPGTYKNWHIASPPFKNAGDWKDLRRPIPGTTGTRHFFNSWNASGTTHRVIRVCQADGTPQLKRTSYTYNALGSRTSENNVVLSYDDRYHSYDQRYNKRQTTGWVRIGGTWYAYSSISGFDARNRRVYKSFTANSVTSTWFFYYDPMDRLTEVVYTPNTASPSTYQVFQLLWLGDKLTAYFQLDLPSATLSRRYVVGDETNRPIEMWNWPTSGNTTRVWVINPSAWGFDTIALGSAYYQPVLFAGQYQDQETTAWQNDGTTVHRPGLVHNGYRTYDPFSGSYLQIDPMVDGTWSTYVYADSNPVGNSDPLGLEKNLGFGGYWETSSCGYEYGGCDEWRNTGWRGWPSGGGGGMLPGWLCRLMPQVCGNGPSGPGGGGGGNGPIGPAGPIEGPLDPDPWDPPETTFDPPTMPNDIMQQCTVDCNIMCGESPLGPWIDAPVHQSPVIYGYKGGIDKQAEGMCWAVATNVCWGHTFGRVNPEVDCDNFGAYDPFR